MGATWSGKKEISKMVAMFGSIFLFNPGEEAQKYDHHLLRCMVSLKRRSLVPMVC